MVVKKHKLELAIDEDFCLLGVVSDEADYKLCWRINKRLNMNFEKQDDLLLYHRKLNEEQVFSMFSYYDDDSRSTYRLIRNRAEKGYFLDELEHIDFLIHIQGEINEGRISSFISSINALEQVRMCVPSDLGRIRNKERLLLW